MQAEPSNAAKSFLAQHGFANAALQAFTADASPRRYFRMLDHGLLLMEDPSDPVGFAAFARVSLHLAEIGLSAPKVIHSQTDGGLAIIEDFGDDTYTRLLDKGADEAELYKLAIDGLLHLHHAPKSGDIDQPLFDRDYILTELSLFAEWFAPTVKADLDVAGFKERYLALWADAIEPVATSPETLILRDFHVDNLMVLPDRNGVERCGLLDFQDAIRGPREYDLVSLLQDARRDLGPGVEQAMLARYAQNAPGGRTAEEINKRYAILGAQRHSRIAGVFVRLCQRDAKPRYLQFLPRVLAQIEVALKLAGLIEIEAFLDQELPGWRKGAGAMALAG